MRRFRGISGLSLLAALALVLMAFSPGSASGSSEDDRSVSATLRDANGTTIGRVVLTPAGESVVVSVRATRLTEGFHGFHIHAVGQCVAPFTTAGGHFNPTNATHGDHAGDLPSLLVMRNGTAAAAVQTDAFTISQLFDADGSAVIVHADRDNFAHIPTRYSAAGVPGPDAATLATGDAGARVACGVVTR